MSDRQKILRATLVSCALAWIGGCSDEPLPPSVEAFMDDPILLDATMVRCVANRDSVSYDPECVNAREAVERLAAAEEEARRAALEAESERKREALRRAREAADEARRRAQALAEERAEAEYLGLIPAPTAPASGDAAPAQDGGTPLVTAGDVPENNAGAHGEGVAVPAPQASGEEALPPAAATGTGAASPERAPVSVESVPAETAPETPAVTTDLGEIRKALEERAPAATGSTPEDPAEPPG
ncbi:MAG TPA: EexN family lipoprotein [Woeseiaceae bacterium]